MIRSVGVLDHPKLPATGEVAAEIEMALREWGVEVHRAKTWDTRALEALVPQVDLIVVLGGDGSTLRAARVAAQHRVPVTSINMGRLGFLSEMTPANWREILPLMLRGEHWLEERMMIRAETHRDGQLLSKHQALNDVVVSRGTLARIVRTETRVDNSALTTYACDGLILATPTGSTAYALAAGGPILPPTLKNFVLVPIAPHLSLDKPVVLSQGSTVEIIVHTDHQAILTADGQNEVVLRDGDRVTVHSSEHVASFARVQAPSYFYRTLMSRLQGEPCE
jgi:NAD+ kinase